MPMQVFPEVIAKFIEHMSLTVKMTCVVFLVGLMLWGGTDYFGTIALEKAYRNHLANILEEKALEYRFRFSRHVYAHSEMVKVSVSLKKFIDYVESINWTPEGNREILYHKRPPGWFPKVSIIRAFATPDYAFLFDSKGKVYEIYKSVNRSPPQKLFFPSKLLLQRSDSESYLLDIENEPYLVTSKTHVGKDGIVKATLLFATQIDERFLFASQKTYSKEIIVALVSEEQSRIKVSSDASLLPPGMLLRDVKDQFIEVKQEFYEYGSSEMSFKFVSFISIATMEPLIRAVVDQDRVQRAVLAFVFIIVFSLLMAWITKRIEHLGWRIADFSQKKLGGTPWHYKKGDQLDILEKRFQLLTEEIVSSNESLKKEKEVAENANKAKSLFLANMSHEIRTPMNAVLGFAEIAKGKITDPQLLDYMKSILASGHALLRLINDILDLSKVEAGKLDLEYSAVSPRELLAEMETIFTTAIMDKRLQLIIDLPEKLPRALLLDESRLRQILINLIGNAIKFTESGYIKLLIRCQYPDDVQQSVVDVVISVEDTGMGIPPDQLESIFESFTQLKGQKSSQFGGTGLGLAITRRLIEMMDGEINISSTVGSGTTFQIILNEIEVASTQSFEDRGKIDIDFESLHFAPCTVLVVDDIDYNRELILGFLGEFGFDFLQAKNGKEAIELAADRHPQIILLDMKMPVMTGYEAAAFLRNDSELEQIPIIAVTASAMAEEETIINKLCDSYLKKPVSKTELVAEMMKYLACSVVPPVEGEVKSVSIGNGKLKTLAMESLGGYPQLLAELKLNHLRIEELLRVMPIDEIDLFAETIKELGEKNNFIPLVDCGQMLHDAVEIIDISLIKQILFELLKYGKD